MSDSECPETINIASQRDVRNAASACIGDQGFNAVVISTDADGLGFNNFTGGFNISVAASAQLQILSFPDLTTLENLNIVDAPALTQISVPKLRADGETVINGITYNGVNAFTPSITISNALQFGGLSLPALTELGDLVIEHVPRRQLTSGGLSKITAAQSITSDNTLDYPGLTSVATLRLTGYEDCRYFLPNLSSVGDFTFTNALGSNLQTSALSVSGSFVLNTSPYRRATNETKFEIPPSVPHTFDASAINIRNLTSVGGNATIESNADARIDLSQLATIGGALSITNNTNSTIDLTKLSQTGALSIVDNVDSTIPRLFNLERADSIHLRGYIDTCVPPRDKTRISTDMRKQILRPKHPALSSLRLRHRDPRALERRLQLLQARLAAPTRPNQQPLLQRHLQRHLLLPLPPLTPSSSSTTTTTQHPSLSTGAWAGIGVAIALVVIGAAVAAWLFLHQRPETPAEASDATTLTNDDGGGSSAVVTRRAIHEADPSRTIVEKDSHYVVSHELYVPPAELPAPYIYHAR
ncbi:hypothetical protein GQX73_g6240 [Xylaria multiplex]|uniref:Receptor L-domain domain-containing protein n=1 Tax=Xylaria multiplex TaxID=323545 RepID=A0A7C8MNC9_9PEZI|nr:hypothetical protein GQX73_g6240 [Xylaria multiplex]